MNNEVLVSACHLKKYFQVAAKFGEKKYVHAVEDISIDIHKGETLGLVGESGCGKTTLGRTILRLHEPTSEMISYGDTTLFDSEENIKVDMTPYRRKMQIIFQDPSASLDPRMTVGEIVGEALDIHNLYTGKKERKDRINFLLEEVGLNAEQSNRYPHEFSGGQQQRIGIARALAVEPEFIVCDEPISALDVSIQSQIINMLVDLQEDKGLTYIFIAHDISVVKHISDRIGVMYLGSLVELVKGDTIYSRPLHPYTKVLLSSVPVPDPEKNRSMQRMEMIGEIPSAIDPPSGCRFHPRCPIASEKCKKEVPQLKEEEPGHFVACFNL